MADHLYQLKFKRVFGQTFFIGLYLLMYPIAVRMVLPRAYAEKDPWVLLMVFVFYGLLTIPGIIIYANYWKYSKSVLVRVTNQGIILSDKKTGGDIDLNFLEIKSLTIRKCSSYKLPWGEFEYFQISGNGKIITIPSFIVSYTELAQLGILTNIPNAKLVQTKTILPLIRE
jgi:hypothetical protein